MGTYCTEFHLLSVGILGDNVWVLSMKYDELPDWSNIESLDVESCLEALIMLKRYKECYGKTAYYQKQQPLIWELAFKALEHGK